MVRLRSIAAASIIAITIGGSAFAALSPKYADWAKGPVQWLMTRDDWRAWNNVKSDEDAQAFIDLFWVRRDPTPGTYINEYRDNFDWRVEYADKNYKSDHGKRGALTEVGRVFILLGPPKNAGTTGAQSMHASGQFSGLGGGATGFSDTGQLSAKLEWEYDRPADLGLTGNIFFIQDETSHEFHYDPQRANVGGAIATAIKRAIHNPELTAFPDWAKVPKMERIVETVSVPVSTEHVEEPAPTPGVATVKRAGKTIETIVSPAGAPGAHDLSLIGDSRSIRPQSETNAFEGVVKKSSFTKKDDIAFMFQFCRPAVDNVKSTLKFAILLSGKVGKESVDIEVPEDETVAEPLKMMPGCSIVRGAIPAASLEAGSYMFTIRVTDPATSQSYNLAQEFKIE